VVIIDAKILFFLYLGCISCLHYRHKPLAVVCQKLHPLAK